MALGTVTVFDSFLVSALQASHLWDFESGNATIIKLAIIDNTVTPLITDAEPRFQATGATVNHSATEVAIAGDYVAGGESLGNPTVTAGSGGNAGAAVINFSVPSAAWATGTDPIARWGILYNATAGANNRCMAFVDLGSDFDMSTGTLTVTMPTDAIVLNQAP